ncbi:MAG: DNA gyrase C-terminal beta-propeller domain-containing protein, partial [Herbiconiux sp.]|nr:DNA gyrase C-terminal beta-propeller domain-containing protein [Herbiconiux sp.]
VSARRSKHDALLSEVETTRRAEVGAITDTGRLIRMPVLDLPAVPATSVQLGAGVRVADYLSIDAKREKVVGLVSLTSTVPIALGTAQGVVKRVTPGGYPPKPDFEVISLKPGDRVVGVAQHSEDDELVFITSDAQLLRFFQASVRPQGLAAGGMAGINLGQGASVLWFGSVPDGDDAVVVTVAGGDSALPGMDAGSGKVSEFAEFPPKGRATGGVRAHRFLKGEDVLTAAWAGRAPALAVGADGAARTLPEVGAKRDASGVPLSGPIGSIGAARRV